MPSPAENEAVVRDNKGFSEETCVRCGWRMGSPALNCQNDATPHQLPSQVAALRAQAEAGAEYEEQWHELAGPEFLDYWFHIGRSCSAGEAIRQLLADRDAAVRERDTAREALRQAESAAIKAAQLLPMTVSTSVEADHRDDHASWAGWLLRHKVLPAIRAALTGEGTTNG